MRHRTFAIAAGLVIANLFSVTAIAAATNAQRQAAARAAADRDEACMAIAPFYWEIGDRDGALVSVRQGDGSITGDTSMLIASASKWVFGAYLVQKRTDAEGVTSLTPQDIDALTLRSGYNALSYALCLDPRTVGGCFRAKSWMLGGNDRYAPRDEGTFDYDGGHFQKYAAVDLGLADKTSGDASLAGSLAQEIDSQVGPGLRLAYNSPQLAAGMRSTPLEYAKFLRKLLRFDQPPPEGLKAGALLGRHAVCTRHDRVSCPNARNAPEFYGEAWHYSLGHWVEDDAKGDGGGAFSSAGAFGFYPWIDAGRTTYGLVARQANITLANLVPYRESIRCGRAIRKAWAGAGAP